MSSFALLRLLRGALLGVSLGAIVSSLTASAEACKPPPPPRPFEPTESSDVTAPSLVSAGIAIHRARDPGATGTSDCSGSGTLVVTVSALDDETPETALAYSLKLVRGTLPFSLPSGPTVEAFNGSKDNEQSFDVGDDGDEYDAVVRVTVLDAAGNESEPKEVHVSGDSVGGCAMSQRSPGGSAFVVGVFALGLLLRRARRC